MSHTAQAEIFSVAQKYRGNAAVDALLLSLQECEIQAKTHLQLLKHDVYVREKALDRQNGFSLMLDQTDIVIAASKAANAMGRMAADYMTLASVLVSLGETIEGY